VRSPAAVPVAARTRFLLRAFAICAMAEILVSALRAQAYPANPVNKPGPSDSVSARPDVRLFALFCALFFPLFSIVLPPADFLKPAQSLALYLARIFHCRSIVFFPENFPAARATR